MSETCQGKEGFNWRAAAVAGGVVVAGVLLAYDQLKPESSHGPGLNYFDIIANLDQYVRSELDESVPYFMLGGGVTAALSDKSTRLDLDNHLIIPPDEIYKPQFREKNGTRADVDIFVASKDDHVIQSVSDALVPKQFSLDNIDDETQARERAKPGSQLKIGVTGFISEDELNYVPQTRRQKVINYIMKDWVSQRAELDDGTYQWSISDIRVNLPDDYFETWHMVLKDGAKIPVLHPLIHLLCYAGRTCHGIRKRDVVKVQSMMNNIGQYFNASLILDDKRQTASIELGGSTDEGIKAAKEFCDSKNELRWVKTHNRLGTKEAAILASRIAVHRLLDEWGLMEQFGQGGPLYDKYFSHFSRERTATV